MQNVNGRTVKKGSITITVVRRNEPSEEALRNFSAYLCEISSLPSREG